MVEGDLSGRDEDGADINGDGSILSSWYGNCITNCDTTGTAIPNAPISYHRIRRGTLDNYNPAPLFGCTSHY